MRQPNLKGFHSTRTCLVLVFSPAKVEVLSRTKEYSSDLLSWGVSPSSVPSGRWSVSSALEAKYSGSSSESDTPPCERSPIMICCTTATINIVVQTVLMGSFYRGVTMALENQTKNRTTSIPGMQSSSKGTTCFWPPSQMLPVAKGRAIPDSVLRTAVVL